MIPVAVCPCMHSTKSGHILSLSKTFPHAMTPRINGFGWIAGIPEVREEFAKVMAAFLRSEGQQITEQTLGLVDAAVTESTGFQK